MFKKEFNTPFARVLARYFNLGRLASQVIRFDLEPVSFGKHRKRTLPQIILHDPDWFFWVLPGLYEIAVHVILTSHKSGLTVFDVKAIASR